MNLFKKFRTTEKPKKGVNICGKLILPVCFMFFSLSQVNGQKGLFVKFSVGPGFTREYSGINSDGLSIVTKNHAIGWGITDNFAVQIGEFGGLNKLKAGDYNYINLDSYGLGFCYLTPIDFKISVLGAYSKVSFAKKWSETSGEGGGHGYGINMSIDKEWFIAKRWGIRLGPQIFWLKTSETDYKFFNASLNGSLVFYITPVR